MSLTADEIAAAVAARTAANGAGKTQAPEAGWNWIDAPTLALPIGPVPWVVPGLQLGPGRPCSIQSYGGGMKTLAAASLVVSCAAGLPVWGAFHVPREMRVRHIDLEMGRRASARRYQRIAFGLDVELASLPIQLSSLPRIRLTDKDAREQLLRAADGVDLVVADSLRAFLGGDVDENDSRARAYLDLMMDVSEGSGVAFDVLHHCGKARDGHADRRQKGRGASAIFDAWGSVLDFTKSEDSVQRVTMTKVHPEGEGHIEPFDLVVSDVPDGANPKAGVLVRQRRAAPSATGPTEEERRAARAARQEQRVEAMIESLAVSLLRAKEPVTSQAMLASLLTGRRAERQDAVSRAIAAGRLSLEGEGRQRRYVVRNGGGQ